MPDCRTQQQQHLPTPCILQMGRTCSVKLNYYRRRHESSVGFERDDVIMDGVGWWCGEGSGVAAGRWVHSSDVTPHMSTKPHAAQAGGGRQTHVVSSGFCCCSGSSPFSPSPSSDVNCLSPSITAGVSPPTQDGMDSDPAGFPTMLRVTRSLPARSLCIGVGCRETRGGWFHQPLIS